MPPVAVDFSKKSGVHKARDDKGNVRGAQFRDPVSNRPEIETVMAYAELPPPPPRPKRATVSKPLPWKLKDKQAQQAAAASLKRTQDTMWSAIKEHQDPRSAAREELSTEELQQLVQKELPSGPIPVTHAPMNMGSARVVCREQPVPFSRDLPPAAQAKTSMKPFGSNPPPEDGHKKCVPLPAHDPTTDVIAFRAKPVAPAPCVSRQPEAAVDIFGMPLKTRPPPQAINDQEEDAGQYDHFKKVISANRTVLVDIAKAKAQSRPSVEPNDRNVSLDIFGRPVKHASGKSTVHRQSMFPGDSERVQLFDDGSGPMRPLTDKKREELRSFPAYITNPPPSFAPRIAPDASSPSNPLRKDTAEEPKIGAKVTLLRKGAPEASHIDFAVPGLGVSKKAAPEAFYASSVFSKILAGCGMWGLRTLRHNLRAMDKNNDGILTRSELNNALLKTSIDLTEPELTALMRLAPPAVVTPEGKPSLIPPKPDFPAYALIPLLMDILRGGDLPVRRRQVCEAAFQKVCKMARKPTHGLSLEDILNVSDFSAHPQFAPHIKGSMRDILQAYSMAWGEKKCRTSIISEEEFIGFYHDFSPLFRNDADFIRVVKGLHSVEK